MSKVVKLAGGRKALGFYLFVVIGTGLFIGQTWASYSISFSELAGFLKWSFVIYAGSNVAKGMTLISEKKQSDA